MGGGWGDLVQLFIQVSETDFFFPQLLQYLTHLQTRSCVIGIILTCGAQQLLMSFRYVPLTVPRVLLLSSAARFGKFGGKDDGSGFKAALLSGPPGVGKTTTAALVCEVSAWSCLLYSRPCQ